MQLQVSFSVISRAGLQAVMNDPMSPAVENESVLIVIPTLNSESTITQSLQSVFNQSYRPLDVVVVDGGSKDRTVAIARELGAKILTGTLRRSSARRAGGMTAEGGYLLFLDSDQELERNVVRDCVNCVAGRRDAALVIPETDSGSGFWLRCRILDRALSNQADLLYPRFIPIALYRKIGGHAPDLENFLEDRDLSNRLIEVGANVMKVDSRIVNLLGRVNPLELGAKGARAADDARVFHNRNKRSGNPLWTVVKPRARGLLVAVRSGEHDALAWLGLPIYALVVHGPRAARFILAGIGSGRARAGTWTSGVP
jgi:glycosyltransferase involved in cell wall biosynthesis